MTAVETRLHFYCSCGAILNAPEDAQGEGGECPSCGKIVVIPQNAFSMKWEKDGEPAEATGGTEALAGTLETPQFQDADEIEEAPEPLEVLDDEDIVEEIEEGTGAPASEEVVMEGVEVMDEAPETAGGFGIEVEDEPEEFQELQSGEHEAVGAAPAARPSRTSPGRRRHRPRLRDGVAASPAEPREAAKGRVRANVRAGEGGGPSAGLSRRSSRPGRQPRGTGSSGGRILIVVLVVALVAIIAAVIGLLSK